MCYNTIHKIFCQIYLFTSRPSRKIPEFKRVILGQGAGIELLSGRGGILKTPPANPQRDREKNPFPAIISFSSLSLFESKTNISKGRFHISDSFHI